MALLRKRGLLHKLTCGCSIVATLLIAPPGSVQAAGKKRPTRAQKAAAEAQKEKGEAQAAATPSEETTIRLNFLNAAWPDVLQKLAKDTGSTLVMQETPPGRFSRTDIHKYGRTEAVRILNRALEPKGFRIVDKNQYLIVLHLDDVRSQYKRPVVRDNSEQQTTDRIVDIRPQADAPATPQQTEITDVTPRKGQPAQQTAAHEADANPVRSKRGAIRQASHDGEAAGTVEQAVQKPVSRPAESSITSVVSIAHGDAAYVAKVLYTALKERSELIDEGPKGLPGFRTFSKETGSKEAGTGEAKGEARKKSTRPAEFSVGIDSERQELIVSAPEKLGTQIEKVFHEIDAAQEDETLALRVVSASDRTLSIGRNLQPELTRLSVQNHRERAREDQLAQQEGQPQQPQQGEQQKQQGNLSEMIQNLGGDVTIESMPDAGVLILRGNPKDVDQVMKVIREIEKLSAGSIPDVRVHPLKHVNADSFAALLNSVYERLTQMRSRESDPRQPVYFFSVAKPNAVLILAPPADMATILQLVNQLDQPVDPTTEFEVFSLQNAVATQVVNTLNELYKTTEEGQEQALKPRVSVYADVRTNSVIVQARPRDLEEVAALVKKIDRDESGAVSKMRIFRLENASADEIANVINAALQSILNPNQTGTRTTGGGDSAGPGGGGGGGGQAGGNQTRTTGGGSSGGQTTQQLREAKSVMLEFMTIDGDAQRVVRSGVLADIRITADPRLNNLVVTAPEQSMQLIAELIKQLDHPADVVAEIKVYTLTNGDAANMVRLLEALFAGRLGNQQSQQLQNQGIDVQLAGTQDPGSMLVPLRFSVDPRTNSVIAIGGSDAQRAVEAVILRLDAGEVRQRKNEVIKLKNSYVVEVAEAINQFLQSQRELAEINPDLVSNVEFLEREIIAVAEPGSNSLLISATPRYFDEIKKIVARLDEAPPQVVIQALLVEVDLQNTDEFGLELGFQDSVLFDRSIIDSIETITETVSNPATGIATTTQQIVSQQATPGFLFNNNPLGNNPAVNSSSVGKQSLSNFSLGRTNNELGFGGLVLSAGSESVSVLLRALSAQRTINILSRPQIRTLDNQEATIQVGQQVPVVNGVTPNALGGIQSPIIIQDNAGIILTVRPRISPDGTIVMETIAEKSQFAGGSVPIFTDATTGNVITSPIKDITIAHSTVSIPNGQTIVMGGMITKTDNTLNRKVPWLGDLPLVGRAFRYDSTTTRRTELLIFLTPRVVKNDQDNELIKQVEAERIHFIVEDAEAIHGPLFGVPQESGVAPTPPAVPKESVSPVPPLPMLPPEAPAEDEQSNVPTTIMPGAAFQSTEPLLLEAGGPGDSEPKQ